MIRLLVPQPRNAAATRRYRHSSCYPKTGQPGRFSSKLKKSYVERSLCEQEEDVQQLLGEQQVEKTKKQQRCPQCHRLVPEAAATCADCQATLPSPKREPAQKQPQKSVIRLRDIFPVLNYRNGPESPALLSRG